MRFSIDALSKLTGIPQVTIRNWEKRYGLISPQRHGRGWRHYTYEDVRLLKKVHGFVEKGHRIGDVAKMVSRGQRLDLQDEKRPWQEQVDKIFDALAHFRKETAEERLKVLSLHLDPEHLLQEIYGELFERLISLRAGNGPPKCSGFIRSFLIAKVMGYMAFPVRGCTEKTVLCASLGTTETEGRMLVTASMLKVRGWNVWYLGAEASWSEIDLGLDRVLPYALCIMPGESQKALEAFASANTQKASWIFVCEQSMHSRNKMTGEVGRWVQSSPGRDLVDHLEASLLAK